MRHTFLSLDMALIPQTTKDNVPTFWNGLFSSDGSRMLIDGRNQNGELVHTVTTLTKWLQWDVDPLTTKDLIISSAIELTLWEYLVMKRDVNSIWYVKDEALT